ncbi:MAG TPA: MFS transporter [Actinospica sp.]|jgi:MFS family permease|nr:MFS transporter [Actinospica sp.]
MDASASAAAPVPDTVASAASVAAPAVAGAEGRAPIRTSTRSWFIWTAGVAVYFVAVFNRSSLGVAGLDAERRFGIEAAALSTFSMLQMIVYASMQIPVGVLIDRFGPRRMLLTGLSVMCAAQACFAAVASFGLALAARGLLGCGDAMVFISVLRLVAAWFPARRVPLLTQLTSLAGAAGGIASTWPLAWALRALGWSGTFLAIAVLGACVLALPAGVVRDPPRGAVRPLPAGDATGRVRAQMRAAWSRPQTRLGLWIHFTTGFPAMVFSLLWGYPFLVQGEGLSSGLASGLLTLLICVNMACCFGFGLLLTRSPQHRVPLALGVVGLTALCLGAVLAWPGRAPLGLLILLVCAYASNGAGSMIGFDIARSANPPERLGTASGMVNVGAFLACGITLLATGVLVDATGAGHAASGAATLSGYKVAFCFPFVLLALGTSQILRLDRRSRTEAVRAEPVWTAPVRAEPARTAPVAEPGRIPAVLVPAPAPAGSSFSPATQPSASSCAAASCTAAAPAMRPAD